jgi:methylated-DNA-protein-cysteine methyltransferase-like protein
MAVNFNQQVYELVKKIPFGYVATYGQIAALMGKPRAARQVGFAMAALTSDHGPVPWWRVVNREGYLSINRGELGLEKEAQRHSLLQENIAVSEDFFVDLAKYRWEVGFDSKDDQ